MRAFRALRRLVSGAFRLAFSRGSLRILSGVLLILVGAAGITWVFRDHLVGALTKSEAAKFVEEHIG